jgi:hypothetical protein
MSTCGQKTIKSCKPTTGPLGKNTQKTNKANKSMNYGGQTEGAKH